MLYLSHRPCGECRELIDVDEGCEHWQPNYRIATAAQLRKRQLNTLAQARRRAAKRGIKNDD